MRMKTEMKVLLYLKRNEQNGNGLCPLMGKITVKGKTNSTAQFGCKIKVDADLWNATSQRCMGKSRVAVKTNKEIESLLLLLRTRFEELIGASEWVSAIEVKNAFQGGATTQMTLLQLFHEHNEEYAQRVGVNRNKKSYYNYTNLYRILSEFLRTKLNVSDVSLKQIDASFAEGFDMFLRIDKRYQAATLSKQFRCLKVVLKSAVYRGLLPFNPLTGYVLPKLEQKQRHLTADELDRIISTPLDTPNRIFTRDMFVFSTFTGICYCDMCNLTVANVKKAEDGSLWIKTLRQKTGTPEVVRLMDIAITIIKKYEGVAAGGKLFPMLTNGSMRKHLKKIALICGINRNLTYHQSRHSFASIVCLSQGVPIETVSKVMGHRNLSTTQHYAKVTHEKIDKDVSCLHSTIEGKFVLQGATNSPSRILKDMSRRKPRVRKYLVVSQVKEVQDA